jgi:DHA3 family macrolide efflux protein-like MFS transporter
MSSPYWPVLRHPQLRRVLPGMAISALGDGMAVVAISWLALQLAPAHSRPAWVALSVAAYTLPATVGTVAFGRFLAGRGSAQLVSWDAGLRGVSIALIPLAYVAGFLTPPLYVTLLAVSSLLHSWGMAGRFTLIAEVLPPQDHLAANALLTIFTEASTVIGPPLAGLIIAWQGAPLVLALDAASFLILAAVYVHAVRTGVVDRPARGRDRAAGLRLILRDPTLRGLLALTFAFFLCFGPANVALPVLVAGQAHGTATLLGLYYTVFAVGSVLGAVAGGYLGRLPLWPGTIGIVVAFGLALLPLGLGAPGPVALGAFAVGGFVWAPYLTTSRTLFQRRAAPGMLPSAMAANNAVVVAALPLGTMLGGPLVAWLGARPALLASALAVVALGLVAALVKLVPGSVSGDAASAERRA